jgi:hypothetical protein
MLPSGDALDAGGNATIVINEITVKHGDMISPLDGRIVSHEEARTQWSQMQLRAEPEVVALIEKAINKRDDDPDEPA